MLNLKMDGASLHVFLKNKNIYKSSFKVLEFEMVEVVSAVVRGIFIIY